MHRFFLAALLAALPIAAVAMTTPTPFDRRRRPGDL